MNDAIQDIINRQFSEYELVTNTKPDKLIDKEDILLSYNQKDRNIFIQSIETLSYGCQHRLELLLPYIQTYIREYNPSSFYIVICLGDILKHQYSIPSICFSRKKTINSILIPNIDLFTGAILQFFHEVDAHDIDYESKSNRAIFIGSSTGSFHNNTRINFCQLARNTGYIEAYIHNLCQAEKDEWLREYAEINSYLHSGIDISDQIQRKIVINIDGNTMCWSRLYWQMRSNSVPVYINKTNEDIQFFDYIDPYNAYIECGLDSAIETIHNILQYPLAKINTINMYGKEYIQKCFLDYEKNPTNFLQNIINIILNKIINYEV